MNNLVRNFELTIWMLTFLLSVCLNEFLQSCHYQLFFLDSQVLLGILHFGASTSCCEENVGTPLAFPPPNSVPDSLLFSHIYSQKPVPFMGQLRHPTFLHLVLVRTNLELCLRRRFCGLSPVARLARIYNSFQ